MGADVLQGGFGADKLKGGDFDQWNDTFANDEAGEAGNMSPYHEDVADTAAYRTSRDADGEYAGVTIDLSVDTDDNGTTDNMGDGLALGMDAGGHAAGDTLYGIENLTGSMAADMFTGDGGANVLKGLMGDDTLVGGGDADMLYGGKGDDVLVGEAGADMLQGGMGADKLKGGTFNEGDSFSPMGTFVNVAGSTAAYKSSDAAVTIDLSDADDNDVLALDEDAGGHAIGDTLYGIENLTGSMMDDMLTGDDGANVLMGDDGADTLTGGAGADTLNGGMGDDVLMGSDEDAAAGLMGGEGMDTLDFSGDEGTGTISIDLTDDNGIEMVMGDMDRSNTINAVGVTESAISITGGEEGDV